MAERRCRGTITCMKMRAALLLLTVVAPWAAALNLPVVLERTGAVRAETFTFTAQPDKQYALLYSVETPSALGDAGQVTILVDGQGAKTLHAGDPDWYTQFRATGPVAIRVQAANSSARFRLRVTAWPRSSQVRAGPIRRWQDAQPVTLGRTVFASGDDAAYVPAAGTSRKANVEDPARTDWYRFEFTDTRPRLVYFQVDLADRDQIPVNLTIHRAVNGKLEEFYDGEDPVALPHEVQALPGNKFTPRVLKDRGTYYIAVRASHPEYKLRTRVYDVPAYRDPQQAVETAIDYLLSAGDSWHANTPRRGGLLDRVSSVHQETSLCVACHATHFTQRGALYAARNGYEIRQREQLHFLTERFYNNPRPLFGFEQQGAVWARMISASANVLSRMSHLLGIFEQQISGERRERFHEGVAGYLKLYYDGRTKLPPDETNGNTPLVSAHEVAWYSWSVTRDARLGELIAGGEVKNTIDLCYQTLALAEIDREKYRDRIARNAERLLSLQRQSGQWSARFEADQPEVEFQTGHALWALHAAGIPKEHPQVAKGLAYLLARQQAFGGWMDPLQSFENFRTPFRETQMAVLALSAYYPKAPRAKGWNAGAAGTLSADPARLLEQLDNVWDRQDEKTQQGIAAVAQSNDALLRQAAVAAMGRLGQPVSPDLLADPSKMVQRTAAWAIRLRHSRQDSLSTEELARMLAAPNERQRWGATRIFAQHFAALARRDELAPHLGALLRDRSPAIRMAAAKALWQYWFWTPSTAVKESIEDSILAALEANPRHPWDVENLQHAVYNIADENIRYLYNNWVPLLAHQPDRERVIAGRLAIESRLAAKFSAFLDRTTPEGRKLLLAALTELPLRRADIYDLEANLAKPAPPVYNRIGNDIEQIAFFGDAAERISKALSPLLDSTDAELRRLAAQAVLMVRETRFGDVNRLAGAPGERTRAVLEKVQSRPDAGEVARALKPPPVNVAATPAAARRSKPKLDEAYFRGYIQPILEKRGKDGQACVHCHASHTAFNATWTTVANVVNQDEPEKSLLLLKPTSTAETEGIAGSGTVAHGGGIRFAKDSPEYVTILEWIKGAKE